MPVVVKTSGETVTPETRQGFLDLMGHYWDRFAGKTVTNAVNVYFDPADDENSDDSWSNLKRRASQPYRSAWS